MLRSLFLLLLLVSLTACQGSFQVPKEQYRERVKTLGVLPLMVDGKSAIEHPDSAGVVALLRKYSSNKQQHFVELLQAEKSYFDVREVSGDPQRLMNRLVRSRSVQETPDGPYHHYDLSPEVVAELARENVVDALLVIVLNGTTRVQKRWDRNRPTYLEAPFNDILASAMVVLPSGEVLWQYDGPASSPFLALQYPNFDEAYYNKTEKVALHFVTLEGVERALSEPGRSWFQDTKLSRPYQELFQDMAKQLKPGLLNPFSSKMVKD